jgi:hypothetical protein
METQYLLLTRILHTKYGDMEWIQLAQNRVYLLKFTNTAIICGFHEIMTFLHFIRLRKGMRTDTPWPLCLASTTLCMPAPIPWPSFLLCWDYQLVTGGNVCHVGSGGGRGCKNLISIHNVRLYSFPDPRVAEQLFPVIRSVWSHLKNKVTCSPISFLQIVPRIYVLWCRALSCVRIWKKRS